MKTLHFVNIVLVGAIFFMEGNGMKRTYDAIEDQYGDHTQPPATPKKEKSIKRMRLIKSKPIRQTDNATQDQQENDVQQSAILEEENYIIELACCLRKNNIPLELERILIKILVIINRTMSTSYFDHIIDTRNPQCLSNSLLQFCAMSSQLNEYLMLLDNEVSALLASYFAKKNIVLITFADNLMGTVLHCLAFCDQKTVESNIVIKALTIILTAVGSNAHELAKVGNSVGQTALHVASLRGYDNVVQVLLNTPEINACEFIALQNRYRRTVLHTAAIHGQDNIVQTLLTFLPKDKADELARMQDSFNGSGSTALDYARNKGYQKIVDLLEPYTH